jgi:hypothetical protein
MAWCDPLYGYYTGVNEIPADLGYAIYFYTDLVLKVRGQSSYSHAISVCWLSSMGLCESVSYDIGILASSDGDRSAGEVKLCSTPSTVYYVFELHPHQCGFPLLDLVTIPLGELC